MFIKNLGEIEGNIDCIYNTDEKYISFSKTVSIGSYTSPKGHTVPIKHQIRFLDSFKVIATSLSQLVSNLDETRFANVKKFFPEDQISLLTRKGVYPYDYMDSSKRLEETQLPHKEAFYSRLNGEHISEENYDHALEVWEKFNMRTSRNYQFV